MRLGDTPLPATAPPHEPHLIFAGDEARLSGSGGCNRVMGSFELDGDTLRLGRLAGTMMACPSGGQLDMLDGTGTLIARFEAVALR